MNFYDSIVSVSNLFVIVENVYCLKTKAGVFSDFPDYFSPKLKISKLFYLCHI